MAESIDRPTAAPAPPGGARPDAVHTVHWRARLVFERYEPDDVTIRLPFREDLTNDGIYFHGGVIASVMDTAGAAAAWSNHDFDRGMRASTVAMSVQYTGAAKRCDLLCHARTARRRKELTFTEITATDADGNVVAHAVQTYRIV